MRRPIVAVAVALALPAPASAYVRIAPVRQDFPAPVAGREVLLGTPARTGAELTAYSLDGAPPRALALPGPGEQIDQMAASSQLVAVLSSTQEPEEGGPPKPPLPDFAGFFGPPAGPLQPLPAPAGDVAVSGDTLLTIERDGVYRRTADGTRTRLAKVSARDARDLQAAGRYAAYVDWHVQGKAPRLRVLDFVRGREVYDVPWEQEAVLTASGRIVRLELEDSDDEDDWPLWILTASPAHPKLRRVTHVDTSRPQLAAAGHWAVVPERAGRLGRLLAVNLDSGRRRVISRPMNAVGDLTYDGRTLTFGAGLCTYAGPLPKSAPPLPRDGCFDVPPELDFGRLKRHGQRVDVGLVCVAPASARCRAVLRLTDADSATLLERQIAVRPGKPLVHLPVPAGTEPKAVELVVDGVSISGGVIE